MKPIGCSDVLLLWPVRLHRLELPELYHRGDEEPRQRLAQGHRHLLHPLPHHLRPHHRRFPHDHERFRGPGVGVTTMLEATTRHKNSTVENQ